MKKLIDILKFIIIGLIQGVSEIFPISSSGHLAIAYDLLNLELNQQLQLTIFLHFASCIALCIYFKSLILTTLKNSFYFIKKKDAQYKKDFMLLIYLVFATIPSIIVGFLIEPFINNMFQQLYFVAIGFILSSLLLFISSKIKFKNKQNYNLKNTFITGLFQCFAILPGISRSGTTFLGSKIAKLNEESGKTFTFLLLLPISIGSTILSIFDFKISTFLDSKIILYFIAMLIAFLSTLLSLKYFFKKFNQKSFINFSLYLLIIGLFFLIYYINF